MTSSSIRRTIRIGGISKSELHAELLRIGIQLNDYARTLFAHEKFTTSKTITSLEVVELSVGELGFAQGATTAQIYQRASELGFSLCPLELGPHLRLQLLDQPEDSQPSKHRAPPGSITIASPPLCAEDDSFPKGFYLRRMNNVLWLRGYRCDAAHVYGAEDRFVFCIGHGVEDIRAHDL